MSDNVKLGGLFALTGIVAGGMGKAMLEPLTKRREGFSHGEMNATVGEANKRIRHLKKQNRNARRNASETEQNLEGEILEKDEIIEALTLRNAELEAELQQARAERNRPGTRRERDPNGGGYTR